VKGEYTNYTPGRAFFQAVVFRGHGDCKVNGKALNPSSSPAAAGDKRSAEGGLVPPQRRGVRANFATAMFSRVGIP
jgi:hypothetical protein